MINIESFYTDYSSLIAQIGEDKISSRYQHLYAEVLNFLQTFGPNGEKLKLNERMLMHAVLEYFSDIVKVKEAHQLEHANSLKVESYLSYWFLRRHPIQVMDLSPEDDDLVFANEKFVLVMLMSFLTQGQEAKPLVGQNITLYNAFANTLYYYLKFRQVDPQSLELVLMSFRLGGVFPECRDIL